MITTFERARTLGREHGRRGSWFSRRERAELLREHGLDPARHGSVFCSAMAMAAAERERARNLQRRGETGPGPYFVVTAEHCSGKSTSHCCPTGSYDDPVDSWECVLSAATATEAEAAAKREFAELVDALEPCACGRSQGAGTNDWWNSVAFTVRQIAGRDV